MPRTLIVGDVHGCSKELRQLLTQARADRVILVGDLFTKGPDPRGVWKLIRSCGAEAVLGNHDVDVLKSWVPGKQLPRGAFRWLRERPLRLSGSGWGVVHAGIDPARGFKRVRAKEALYLRTLSSGRHAGRPWWRAYRGKRLIVHGHDARVGLNDRRPYSLGIDTDCVRGGALTGYLVEKDKLLQVPARRAYA